MPAKKKPRTGMPFSLVAYAPNREWLEKLPERISLLREMRPEAGKDVSVLMREADRLSKLALKAVDSKNSDTAADTAAFAAMNAVHCAWQIEILIGAVPLVRAALKREGVQVVNSKTAAEIREAETREVENLVKILLEKMSQKLRGQSRNRMADDVISKAQNVHPQTDAAVRLAGLKRRQVLTYIKNIEGPPPQKNKKRKATHKK